MIRILLLSLFLLTGMVGCRPVVDRAQFDKCMQLAGEAGRLSKAVITQRDSVITELEFSQRVNRQLHQTNLALAEGLGRCNRDYDRLFQICYAQQ